MPKPLAESPLGSQEQIAPRRRERRRQVREERRGRGRVLGQLQEFEVSAGPLPEVDQIVFKALQTYSDRDVVRWIDEPVANGPEPEHPAPVLKLTKKTTATPSAGVTAQAGNTPVATTDDDMGGWTFGIGIAALIGALAALAIAMLAWRRTTRPTRIGS